MANGLQHSFVLCPYSCFASIRRQPSGVPLGTGTDERGRLRSLMMARLELCVRSVPASAFRRPHPLDWSELHFGLLERTDNHYFGALPACRLLLGIPAPRAATFWHFFHRLHCLVSILPTIKYTLFAGDHLKLFSTPPQEHPTLHISARPLSRRPHTPRWVRRLPWAARWPGCPPSCMGGRR